MKFNHIFFLFIVAAPLKLSGCWSEKRALQWEWFKAHLKRASVLYSDNSGEKRYPWKIALKKADDEIQRIDNDLYLLEERSRPTRMNVKKEVSERIGKDESDIVVNYLFEK